MKRAWVSWGYTQQVLSNFLMNTIYTVNWFYIQFDCRKHNMLYARVKCQECPLKYSNLLWLERWSTVLYSVPSWQKIASSKTPAVNGRTSYFTEQRTTFHVGELRSSGVNKHEVIDPRSIELWTDVWLRVRRVYAIFFSMVAVVVAALHRLTIRLQ